MALVGASLSPQGESEGAYSIKKRQTNPVRRKNKEKDLGKRRKSSTFAADFVKEVKKNNAFDDVIRARDYDCPHTK